MVIIHFVFFHQCFISRCIVQYGHHRLSLSVKGRFHGPMKVIFFSHRRIYFGRWVSPISVGRRSEIGAYVVADETLIGGTNRPPTNVKL